MSEMSSNKNLPRVKGNVVEDKVISEWDGLWEGYKVEETSLGPIHNFNLMRYAGKGPYAWLDQVKAVGDKREEILKAILELAPGILVEVANSYNWEISEGTGPAKPMVEERDAYLKQLRELFNEL